MEQNHQILSLLASHISNAFCLGCSILALDGTVVASSGSSTDSCRICSLLGKDREQCRGSHLYSLHEAERFGGKYVYFCNLGLSCITRATFASDGISYQIVLGPFLMVDPEDYIEYELKTVHALTDREIQVILPAVSSLPHIHPSRVSSVMELVFMASGFLDSVSSLSRHMEQEERILREGVIWDYLQTLQKGSNSQPYPFREEQALSDSIRDGDRHDAEASLNKLWAHHLHYTGSDPELMRWRANELFTLISRAALQYGCSENILANCISAFRSILNAAPSVNTVYHSLHGLLQEILSSVRARRMISAKGLSESVRDYIQAHYAEKVSLQGVADLFSISPSYLSTVFKQENRIGFSSYLSQYRIEQSIRLMRETDLSFGEIALECGFSDQSYYSSSFRKYTGLSPSQYRSGLNYPAKPE